MANPILPFWEYIPDGEPRVFGDRVYLYGSHDRVGVSDHPEGPFELLSKYEYRPGNEGDEGIFNDVGVLVDDDGRNKYFDFGQDYGTKTMILALQIKGTGSNSIVHVHIDADDGPEIGSGEIGLSDGVYKIRCEAVTGRHAMYLVAEVPVEGWTRAFFEEKTLFELQAFTFFK